MSKKIITRAFRPPKGSFFLFGPRGTGKSTFLREQFPDALYLDLLLPDVFRSYSARPERLQELVQGNPEKTIIVLDEIQKVPELLSVVHVLIERYPEKQFVLTGSSARKLRRAGTNLLGGRALRCSLHPFTASELGMNFSLEDALQFGLLPLVHSSADPRATLQTYLDLYIREEVQAEGLTRNMGQFSRFLEAISFSHGSLLNVSNVAREAEVERKTVENYIGILEDLLLAFRIPVFQKRAKRAVVKHEKFYLFDSGVFRALRPTGPLDSPEEVGGAALEGLVAQHLRAWIENRREGEELFFFRTKSGTEVDFIVYGPKIFWAIEIKNSAKINPRDSQSLRSFQQDYPECKTFLLSRDVEKRQEVGVLFLGVEEFLQKYLTKN